MSVMESRAATFDKPQFEQLMAKRFFYTPAFEIYGGVAGLYDYGPPGSSLQSNILHAWRQHFIVEEDMLELDTTIMTLSDVLVTSGHVAKFSDWMCKDVKTGEIFRADHLVEAVLEARLKGDKEARGIAEAPVAVEDDKKKKKKKVASTAIKLSDEEVKETEYVLAQIDNYSGAELGELIRKFKIVNPETKNEVSEPEEFNLMFSNSIGPTGYLKGYLRPETAQGHFVNFSRLLEFNNGKVPFASAQIGRSFRNEISPRQGLLRVREFTMAEIEHFVDPLDKRHARFSEVKDLKLSLLPKDVQLEGKTELVEMTVGDAVDKQIIDNETLGYFIGRIHLFLVSIGIDPSRLRFRQHMDNEMAHYAADCWDAEIQSSYGWIECVGCADRSAYDLSVHAEKTKQRLSVQVLLPEPVIETKLACTWDKKTVGMAFKKEAGAVMAHVEALDQDKLTALKTELESNGKYTVTVGEASHEILAAYVKIEPKTTKTNIREFTPNVIEPSFGIGRILYSVLEHSFWRRESDSARQVLSLPTAVAPFKCLIVPISNNPELSRAAHELSLKMRKAGIACRVDDSGASIGKRYSRNDELGTPFGATVDFASVKNGTITLRERDTTEQLIGSIDEVISVISQLVKGQIDWSKATGILPAYSGEQDVE
ncbi:glycine-trna ligase [Phaffia rhodozyma]|uniref:glycine--tRNA ligase n=1 Tax=Phaffia rhodozyma TaxID=264483 RepID=A0A0F7SJR8_PHARH|nr:glycine-trna ligase [Phaffia rhodozyma]